MRHILILEDDKVSNHTLANILLDAGYSVHQAYDLATASGILQTQADITVVMVCDLLWRTVQDTLPIDIRRTHPNCGLIVLLEDFITSGTQSRPPHIDACLRKPIAKEELLSTLLNVIVARAQHEAVQAARSAIWDALRAPVDALTFSINPVDDGLGKTADSNISRVRDLVINYDRSEVTYRGKPLQLTRTEFEILNILVQSAGRVISFEDIVFRVHKVKAARSEARRMLSSHLTYLRAKMREAGCDHYLVNSRARGYMIDAAAEDIAQDAEEQLGENLIEFQAVWNNAADAMAISDRDSKVIAANPAYFALCGYSESEVIGQNFTIIFPEQVRLQAEMSYQSIFDGAETMLSGYEAIIRRRDGQEILVQSKATFLELPNAGKLMLSIIRELAATGPPGDQSTSAVHETTIPSD